MIFLSYSHCHFLGLDCIRHLKSRSHLNCTGRARRVAFPFRRCQILKIRSLRGKIGCPLYRKGHTSHRWHPIHLGTPPRVSNVPMQRGPHHSPARRKARSAQVENTCSLYVQSSRNMILPAHSVSKSISHKSRRRRCQARRSARPAALQCGRIRRGGTRSLA